MKQIATLVLGMVFSFYYSQTTTNSTVQSKNPSQQENFAALYQPNKVVATDIESVNATADAPQADICTPLAARNYRTVLPNTGCKQYVYCVYKRDGSRELFSSFIYDCPTISKFNPYTQKCTTNVFTCPS